MQTPGPYGPQEALTRCVYCGAAGEENELSFVAGETINVTEKIDENWWRGYNAAGNLGMFPSNYVQEN